MSPSGFLLSQINNSIIFIYNFGLHVHSTSYTPLDMAYGLRLLKISII